MKRILIVLTVLIGITACSDTAPADAHNDEVAIDESTSEETPLAIEDEFYYDTLKGMYVGDFGGSDIRVILNFVSQKNAVGYNVHKGLQRNISGKVSKVGDSVIVTLHEPGDNKFDGVFTLIFNGIDQHPTGSWVSINGNVPKRNFTLDKMVRPKGGSDEITMLNFANYFGYVSDTIGDYHFSDDGLCVFEYYPREDREARVEQLIEIKGSWTLKGKHLTIDWQPNKVFPDRKLEFDIVELEYGEQILRGAYGHELHPLYW